MTEGVFSLWSCVITGYRRGGRRGGGWGGGGEWGKQLTGRHRKENNTKHPNTSPIILSSLAPNNSKRCTNRIFTASASKIFVCLTYSANIIKQVCRDRLFITVKGQLQLNLSHSLHTITQFRLLMYNGQSCKGFGTVQRRLFCL